MRKEAFLKQLEYLLQDIPDGDKEEAISYYRDYLEEAGSENEEAVIEEFGSPERVAAIIRADISGNLKEGGSFTETGYEDERFKDPNFQVAKRLDLPDEQEEKAKAEEQGPYEEGSYKEGPFQEKYTRSRVRTPGSGAGKKPWTSRILKFMLWAVLLVMASPFLLGAAGIGLGGLAGIVATVFGILVAALCLTAAAFVASVALGVFGIILFTATSPFDGMLVLGIAVLGLGCGLLGAGILIWFFWKVIPLCFRGLGKLWDMIFKRRRKEEPTA